MGQGFLSGKPQENLPSLSVLIAIRNEEKRLAKCLESLEAQNYPEDKLQIVLVNDRSEDRSPEMLETYTKNSKWPVEIVTITETTPNISPKKNALSHGIKKCYNEVIVSTDADCHFGNNWLMELGQAFEEDTGMVMGLTSYSKNEDISPLLWGIESLEFFSHAVVASSMVANNFPINTNANNMAYRKKAYEEVQKLESHAHIVSGDDDFLLQKMFSLKHWKLKYLTHPDSQVETEPSLDWKTVWEQRKRWSSKCSHYETKQVLFLLWVYLYYCAIFWTTVAGAFKPHFLWLGVGSWVLKSFFDFQVMRKAAQLFHKEKLMYWFVPTAIFQVAMVVFATLFGSFGSFTWKGQKVKSTLS